MKIRYVHFEAFKSLYDVVAQFGELTVITGANGSGKSNLVDGLVFIANTYLHGLEFAVGSAGGYENIAHRRTRRARRPIRIKVAVELTSRDVDDYGRRFIRRRAKGQRDRPPKAPPLRIEYEFSFRAASQKLTADFSIVEERLSISLVSGERVATITRVDNSITVARGTDGPDLSALMDDMLFFLERDDMIEVVNLDPTELFIDRRYLPDIFFGVSRFLSSINVFQLSPHTSRLPGVSSPGAKLERHGENLPGAADYLRRNQIESWVRVQAAMRSIIPTLESISIAYTEDRRLAVQFRERGVGRPWNASEVSDGTIQTFALLVAIFDRRSSILVIEELENALHPWILRQLLEICRESSRQILLTTHSPVLLNAVSPSDVYVMWMRSGRSALAPLHVLDRELSGAVLSGDISAFDLYDSGAITEAVPRGLGGEE